MDSDELRGWLRLTLAEGIGPSTARRLLGAFGPPDALFSADPRAWQAVAGEAIAKALEQAPAGLDDTLARTRTWLDEDPAQRAVVTLGDAGYPDALLQADDPPVLLYLQGSAAARARLARGGFPAVAVVGSRQATPQGLQNARQFSQALARAGVTIVSGLAAGIDGAAHQGALDAAEDACGAQADLPIDLLPTVAVVGTGLDRVYPARHRALAHRIVARGVILSEYPIGTPPLPPNFPRRNRLIAALSRATLVVEAALPSGSLITARMALEQGRDVLAIPGSIQSPQSRGCHALIKQGARLVDSVQDVLEELGLDATAAAAATASTRSGGTGLPNAPEVPDASGSAVLQALGHDPVGLDVLASRCGLDAAALQAQLLTLELQGQVGRLPGGRFQRLTPS